MKKNKRVWCYKKMKDINMCKRGERMVVVGIVIENVCV
jgi:hypothetical protein